MDTGTIMRWVNQVQASHTRRQSEFAVPSAVHVGHQVIVRRLDENARPVSESDIHFVMHAQVLPGHSAVLRNHSGKPSNKFAVYVTVEPSMAMLNALAPPRGQVRGRSV